MPDPRLDRNPLTTPPCELPVRNPSDHKSLLGPEPRKWAPMLEAFARRFYADDLALYRRHCGHRRKRIASSVGRTSPAATGLFARA